MALILSGRTVKISNQEVLAFREANLLPEWGEPWTGVDHTSARTYMYSSNTTQVIHTHNSFFHHNNFLRAIRDSSLIPDELRRCCRTSPRVDAQVCCRQIPCQFRGLSCSFAVDVIFPWMLRAERWNLHGPSVDRLSRSYFFWEKVFRAHIDFPWNCFGCLAKKYISKIISANHGPTGPSDGPTHLVTMFFRMNWFR